MTYVRDAKKVLSALVTRPDKSVVTKVDAKIVFPVRFEERLLAQLGVENLVIGLFPIIIEEGDTSYYSLLNVNAMVSLNPTDTKKTSFNGTDYYCMEFAAGSVIINTLELVQSSAVLFRLYDELFSKGKIPWYINYEDLGSIFDTAKKHAGASVGDDPEVIQLLAAIVSRDPKDRTKYYRSIVESRDTLRKVPPAYIPLRSVQYAATNTVNKIAGSYFSDGVTSALLAPSDRVESIEQILRA